MSAGTGTRAALQASLPRPRSPLPALPPPFPFGAIAAAPPRSAPTSTPCAAARPWALGPPPALGLPPRSLGLPLVPGPARDALVPAGLSSLPPPRVTQGSDEPRGCVRVGLFCFVFPPLFLFYSFFSFPEFLSPDLNLMLKSAIP